MPFTQTSQSSGLFLFTFLLFSSLNLFAQEWLNPKPSGNSALDIEFTASGKGYILNDGEILSTSDLGVSWIKKQSISGGNDIDFNGTAGYIVGNNGIIYKSNNEGVTWKQLNASTNDNLNSVSVVSSDTVIISSANKIIKSTDGGISWAISNVPSGNTIIKSAFTNGKTGHAVCNGKIIKTTDGGSTWTSKYSANFTPSNFFTVYFLNAKVGFASRAHNAILKTTNGGESWTEIPNTSDAIYSFSFIDENTGFIAGDHGVIHKTIDGGNTWTWAGFQNGRYYATSMYGVWFTDANKGFACGMGGRILKTIDGGKTWESYSPTHSAITGFFLPPGNSMYAVGNKIFKSTDNGNTWNTLNNDLDYTNYSYKKGQFFSAETGYVLADGNYYGKILKTTDGGQSWQDLTNNFGYAQNFHSLYFLNSEIGFISGDKNGLDRYVASTVDGGQTWNIVKYGISFSQLWFTDAKNGLGLSYGDLYQTSDGGKTWTKTYEVYGDLEQINFLNKDVGYIAAEFNTILKTTDGGKTWKELKTEYDHLSAITFVNQNVGYVTGEYGTFQSTTNGGLTWEQKQFKSGINFLVVKDDYLYMAGNNGLIVREPLNVPAHSVKLAEAINIYADKADISAIIASNRYLINNVKLEYGTTETLGSQKNLNYSIIAGTSDSVKTKLENLLPSTKYYYRISFSSNNSTIYSEIKNFTTREPISLITQNVFISDPDNITATAQIGANIADVSGITFEYGTNGTFTTLINADPFNVKAYSTTLVNARLNNLETETTYTLRLKADCNGKTYYSNQVSFTTLPDYRFNVQQPQIINNTANISVAVQAIRYKMSNLEIEYGKTASLGLKVKTATNLIEKGAFDIASGNFPIEASTLYYFRISAIVNGNTVYSPTFSLNSDQSLLLDMLSAESVTDSTATLKASINPQRNFVSQVEFEYGKTTGYGSRARINPVSTYSPVQVNAFINKLEANTTYHFRLKVLVGSEYFFSDDHTFTTSSANANEEKKIVLYPNPVNDKLKFKVSGKPGKIQVCNLNGTLVLNEVFTKPEADVSQLPAGVYILKVITEDRAYSSRFIKN